MNFVQHPITGEFKQWLPTPRNANAMECPANDGLFKPKNLTASPCSNNRSTNPLSTSDEVPYLGYNHWCSPRFDFEHFRMSPSVNSDQSKDFSTMPKFDSFNIWKPIPSKSNDQSWNGIPPSAVPSYYKEISKKGQTFFQKKKRQSCSFCRQNGERREFFMGHILKDEDGKVICPILREHVCEICGETGIYAHTRAYCPYLQSKSGPIAIKFKKTHDSCGRMRK